MVVSRKIIALVISAVTLLVCLGTMVGGTYATNATTFNADTNLGLNLYHVIGENKIDLRTDTNHKFLNNTILWEPGYTAEIIFEVENKGSLSFDYWLYPHLGTSNNGDEKLAEVLEAKLIIGNTTYSLGTLKELSVPNTKPEESHGKLSAGSTETIKLQIHMQESAGNQYKSLSLTNVCITCGAVQSST